MTTADAAKAADMIMILVSDHIQGDLYEKEIAPHTDRGQDADVRARLQHPLRRSSRRPEGVDVSMVAPKAPGHRVRELYVEGVGVPALVAVHQNATGQGDWSARWRMRWRSAA